MKAVEYVVEEVEIGRVKRYDRNPRRIPKAAVAGLANSIELYGWTQPIVVDADYTIIMGHARLRAAKRLKLKTVPVHVAADLDPDRVRSLRIADNQVATLTEWDDAALLAELEAFDEAGLAGLSNVVGETWLEKAGVRLSPSLYFVKVRCPDEAGQRAVHEAVLGAGLDGVEVRMSTID
ncbi:MAG: ParB N-terminal domain-containing protein [Planctomycetota bacterium]